MINYNDLIGIPFDEHNINGINCYELLRKVYKKNGIFIPDTSISVCACQSTSNKEIKDNIIKYWIPISKPEVICGVVILSTNPNFANHIATYIGNGKIIHVSKNINSVIERISPKYKNKIVGFYKFIGSKI